MPNPLISALNGSKTTNNASFKDVYNQFMNMGNNPRLLFENIASRNPQLQPVVQLLRGGMNEEQVFNMVCQQRGINPQQFLNQIMNMINTR
jgi:hypothetical protein